MRLCLCPEGLLDIIFSVRLSGGLAGHFFVWASLRMCVCAEGLLDIFFCASVRLFVGAYVRLCVSVILALVVVRLENVGANRTLDATMRRRRQNTWHMHIFRVRIQWVFAF